MDVRPRPRRSLAMLAGATAALLIAGCGSSTPQPNSSAPSAAALASAGSASNELSASPRSSPSGSGASLGPGASSAGPAPSAPPPDVASVEPFTPPPMVQPQDDDVCLAFLPRATVETAYGSSVGSISADGTDPNTNLTCTYPVAGGQLLVTTAAGDPDTAFQAELDTATAYGQDPQALDGVGSHAFYAAASAAAPEQVVFTKGPVLVRLWNRTSAVIGKARFETLARKTADAIRAEIPPAP